jgi:cytochrome c553
MSAPRRRSLWIPVLVASFAACNAGELGDEPVERCVPEGACDEAMFHGGLSAAFGDASRGAALFAKECARCHGDAGKGIAEARRIDMTSPAWQASMRDGVIVKTVRGGRLPLMPAFAFSDEQLKDLLAHLRRLEVAPASSTRKGY